MIRPIVIVALAGSTIQFLLACIIPILGIYLSSAVEAQTSTVFPVLAIELLVVIVMCLISLTLGKKYPQLWLLWLVSSSLVVAVLGWVGSIGHLLAGGNTAAVLFWAGLIGSIIPVLNGIALMIGRGRREAR